MGTAVLNEVNIRATHLDKYRRLIESTHHWHKFIINNSSSIDRNTLLNSVLRTVFPNDLIPLHFKNEYMNSNFLAKNCRGAIEELYNKGLVIPDPIYGGMLNVTIILGFKKLSDLDINYHENILTVIHKRYNNIDGTLNLSRFHEDPELTEYFPLFQPIILEGILRLCKGINIKHLNLSENRISQLKSLKSIWKYMDLKKLDLSKNMISSFEELQVLRNFNSLEEIIIEQNPFCAQYNEHSYLQTIVTVLPNLKKLDFVTVRKEDLLSLKKNYLCCPEGHDFVDQFLDHFFILYDKQRSSLRDTYHLGATLTISCHYNKDRENYAKADLECYTSFARNLKTLSDITNSYDNMFIGCDNVMAILCQLPPTNHDPCSFTVDLVSFTYNFAMVIVTGIFQEVGGQILGFNRTFVLVSTDGLQYFIINDKLHINQATIKQYRNAFEEVSINNVNAISEITSLNMQWSKKCLKDCDGDLKTALILFNELFLKDEIPNQAFDRSFFTIDPIKFNFKNKENIVKKTLNSSINKFKFEDHTDKEIICSKNQNLWDDESRIISFNTQNRKLQSEAEIDDLKQHNDIFKLARKNLDLKMKQINDVKKAEYISNNEYKDISRYQRVYSSPASLNDKSVTQFERKCEYEAYKKVNSQEMNPLVTGFKTKIPSVMNKRCVMSHVEKTPTKKVLHNPNIIVVDLTDDDILANTEQLHFKSFKEYSNDKYFNQNLPICRKNKETWKNMSTVHTTYYGSTPSSQDGSSNSFPNLHLNSNNDRAQYMHLSPPKNIPKKSVSAKSGVNNTKVIRTKQKIQAQRNVPKRRSYSVKLLSTFARIAYSKLQRGIIERGWMKEHLDGKSNSFQFFRSRIRFRLSFLAYTAYCKLVKQTRHRVRQISNINVNDLYIIYKTFIHQQYSINYYNIRIRELNDAYGKFKPEQEQHLKNNSTLIQFKSNEGNESFYAAQNTFISLQANGICLFSTSKLNDNLIEIIPTRNNLKLNRENKIVQAMPSSITIGNVTQSLQNSVNFSLVSTKRERIRQNSKRRRFLIRQAKKLKKMKECLKNSDCKITSNKISAQGSSTCSLWSSKELVKTDVSDKNQFKSEIKNAKFRMKETLAEQSNVKNKSQNHRNRRRRQRRRVKRQNEREKLKQAKR